MISAYKDHTPKIAQEVFIAPNAWVIGDVELAERVSVFFGAVLRGDILAIRVGAETNIQEHALLHTSHGRAPTIVGSQVTIGHRAIVHGCTIEDRALIGMGAIVLDEAVVGSESLIAAGAVVTEGTIIPPRSMVMGVPGKVVREITDEEAAGFVTSAKDYVATGANYLKLNLSSS